MEANFSNLTQTLRLATDPSNESINAHRKRVQHYVAVAVTVWDHSSTKDLPNPWADVTNEHLDRLSVGAGELITRLLDGREISVPLLEALFAACSAVAPMSAVTRSAYELDLALQAASDLAKQGFCSLSAIDQDVEQLTARGDRHLLLPNIPRHDLPQDIATRLKNFPSWLPDKDTIETLDRRFSEVFSQNTDLSVLAGEVVEDVRSEMHDRGLSWGITSDWDRKVTLYKAMLRQLTSKSKRRWFLELPLHLKSSRATLKGDADILSSLKKDKDDLLSRYAPQRRVKLEEKWSALKCIYADYISQVYTTSFGHPIDRSWARKKQLQEIAETFMKVGVAMQDYVSTLSLNKDWDEFERSLSRKERRLINGASKFGAEVTQGNDSTWPEVLTAWHTAVREDKGVVLS